MGGSLSGQAAPTSTEADIGLSVPLLSVHSRVAIQLNRNVKANLKVSFG